MPPTHAGTQEGERSGQELNIFAIASSNSHLRQPRVIELKSYCRVVRVKPLPNIADTLHAVVDALPMMRAKAVGLPLNQPPGRIPDPERIDGAPIRKTDNVPAIVRRRNVICEILYRKKLTGPTGAGDAHLVAVPDLLTTDGLTRTEHFGFSIGASPKDTVCQSNYRQYRQKPDSTAEYAGHRPNDRPRLARNSSCYGMSGSVLVARRIKSYPNPGEITVSC